MSLDKLTNFGFLLQGCPTEPGSPLWCSELVAALKGARVIVCRSRCYSRGLAITDQDLTLSPSD
jgi:hypothetical protein